MSAGQTAEDRVQSGDGALEMGAGSRGSIELTSVDRTEDRSELIVQPAGRLPLPTVKAGAGFPVP